MALICVVLAGFCLGLIGWGWSASSAGLVVMSGLVGCVAVFVAWRLGREAPVMIITETNAFWRVDRYQGDDHDITAEGLDMGDIP